jgi:hypothetical protein
MDCAAVHHIRESNENVDVFMAAVVLIQGGVLAVTHFKDVWKTRVPPKIKVFLWQLIRGKLPCSEQVAMRQGPSNGVAPSAGR